MAVYDDLVIRFMKRTKISGGHWIWQGATSKKSRHGLVTIDRNQVYLHRYMFCLKNDLDYSEKFFACHKVDCNIPRCWNPDHIYKGDAFTNAQDTVTNLVHVEARKTRCSRGHEYSGHNLIINGDGKRVCKTCRQASDRNRIRITVNGKRRSLLGTRVLK